MHIVPSSQRSATSSRRRFGLAVVSLLAGLHASASRAVGSGSQQVVFDWVLPREQVAAVNGVLGLSGDQIRGDPNSAEDTKGLPLLYVLLGAVVVVALAEAMLAIYKDAKYGGLSVNATGNKFVVRSNPAIPAGTIIIKDKDGKVRVHELPAKGTLEKLTELLVAAIGK